MTKEIVKPGSGWEEPEKGDKVRGELNGSFSPLLGAAVQGFGMPGGPKQGGITQGGARACGLPSSGAD